MSNTIYATTANTIGIDSSNVDISGSLSVTGHVSINNGDVSINGKLNINTLSSNNLFGTSGEIFMSQGPNNPPIWYPYNSKVYGFAYTVNNEIYTTLPRIIGKFNPLNIPLYSHSGLMVNGHGSANNFTGFKMIVPRTGIYKVEVELVMGSDRGPIESQWTYGAWLLHNNNKVAYSEFGDNPFINPQDGMYFFPFTLSGIFQANEGEYFQCEPGAVQVGNSVVMGDPGDGRRYTRFSIHNVD